MRQIKDISKIIRIEDTPKWLRVTLQANQYQMDRLVQYQQFLRGSRQLLAGNINQASDEELQIHYEKNCYARSIEQECKKLDRYHRLLLSQKMGFLVDFFQTPIQPFIHPANLFVFGEEVFIGHRGLMADIVPYSMDEQSYLKQYRALILMILHPKLNYEMLIEGNGILKDSFSQQIQNAETIAAIERILGEQIMLQKSKREQTKCFVNKSSYQAFKWLSIFFATLTFIFAGVTGNYAINKLPAQERISAAGAQYIANDFAGVLKTLEEDVPEVLPKETKYVAAVSSVQLDNLSNEQKTNILNNLSQKSSDNMLLYWIYIGKSEFDRALDIALNMGDNQFILHTYTKLYDATKVNNTMNGEKKQELLIQYEEEIIKYLDILGGEDTSNENEASSDATE